MIALIASAEGSDGPVDERRDQRQTRGLGHRVEDAEKQGQPEQQLDRDRIGVDERRKQGRLDAAGDLRHPDDPDPVAAVGEGAGERAEKHHGKEFGHRDDAEPGAGMGQGPGQPADRDALHPHADQRDRIAAGVDAVIPVGEGLERRCRGHRERGDHG